MFAETYPYIPFTREMRRRYVAGDIGEVRYTEAEYLDEPADLMSMVDDRSHWRARLPATYYCTHSLAPVAAITGTGQSRSAASWRPLPAARRRWNVVSDVVQVVDATTIILADATSAAVNNVEVILNDPDRVALSNYARRDVSDLTVDLGDRSVDDATMRIGGRGLESATARFSSLDLDKEVTIQAAGLLVTTIQSVDSPTQATLTAPAQRAVENVQADVWKTDSRPGLELLLERSRACTSSPPRSCSDRASTTSPASRAFPAR